MISLSLHTHRHLYRKHIGVRCVPQPPSGSQKVICLDCAFGAASKRPVNELAKMRTVANARARRHLAKLQLTSASRFQSKTAARPRRLIQHSSHESMPGTQRTYSSHVPIGYPSPAQPAARSVKSPSSRPPSSRPRQRTNGASSSQNLFSFQFSGTSHPLASLRRSQRFTCLARKPTAPFDIVSTRTRSRS